MNGTDQKIHVWEAKGLGKGPFRFVAMVSFAGPEMAEHNPEAYMRANAEASRTLAHFKVMGGICDACGMCLMNNFIIRDSQGKHFVVGCDCVRKTHDAPVISQVKAFQAKERKAKKDAERQARWEADAPARAAKNARIESYQAARAAIAEGAKDERARASKWLSDVLGNTPGDFAQSVRSELAHDGASLNQKSDRFAQIMADIYTRAMAHGARGTKRQAVQAEFDRLWDETCDLHSQTDARVKAQMDSLDSPY